MSSGVDAGADAAIETGAAGATDAAVAAPSLPADLRRTAICVRQA